MPTADAFLYLFARNELRASDWARGDFQALLIGQGYDPQAGHTISDLAAAELQTDGYGRKPLRGRTVVNDQQNSRTLLKCANLLWAGIGPPVDGPVVTGVAIVAEVDERLLPVAFFRLPAQQLVGMNYGLSTKANEGVLLRLN